MKISGQRGLFERKDGIRSQVTDLLGIVEKKK